MRPLNEVLEFLGLSILAVSLGAWVYSMTGGTWYLWGESIGAVLVIASALRWDRIRFWARLGRPYARSSIMSVMNDLS